MTTSKAYRLFFWFCWKSSREVMLGRSQCLTAQHQLLTGKILLCVLFTSLGWLADFLAN